MHIHKSGLVVVGGGGQELECNVHAACIELV
jgi:hypothetical protein